MIPTSIFKRSSGGAPALLAIALLASHAAAAPPIVPPDSQQLLVVSTADWNTTTGTLRRWERAAGGPWLPVGEVVEVVVGAAGLGWGRGLHARETTTSGPMKREGDNRGPAGVFRVGTAFGYARRAAPGVRWPYRPLTRRSMCVDDPQAAAYNLIVEAPATTGAPPWRSAERMRYAGEAYRVGLLIEHNTAPTEPGAGSCTFVHPWAPPNRPTAGCTAMAPADLDALVRWLRPDRHPVIVQAPAAIQAAWAARWGTPPATAVSPAAPLP